MATYVSQSHKRTNDFFFEREKSEKFGERNIFPNCTLGDPLMCDRISIIKNSSTGFDWHAAS